MAFEDTDTGLEAEQPQESRAPMTVSGGNNLMTLKQLVTELNDHRRTLAIAVAATFAVTVLYLIVAPIKYEAFVKIAPTEERSTSVSSASEGFLSTIGLNLGADEFRRFDHFVETLTSVKLAEQLNRDEKLGQRIFPYDKESGRFKRSWNPVALVSSAVKWVFGQPAWVPPQSYDLAAYFENQLALDQDRETAVVTIKYSHKNQKFAEEVLSKIILGADGILREDEKATNQARHAYLQQRLGTEVRQINRALVSELLLDAEQRLMLANVDPMFGARIIDGPTSGSKPASPRVLLTLVLGVIVGFMIGISVVATKILMRDPSDR